MPARTYKQARADLLAGLAANGWTVNPNLKVPTARKGDAILFFKPQAIWGTHREYPRAARSLLVDSKTITVEGLEAEAHSFAAWTYAHERNT